MLVGTMIKPDCTRCGHSPDWHRLPSELSPTDPDAVFPCTGPQFSGCATSCADFQRMPVAVGIWAPETFRVVPDRVMDDWM